ncbi:adhesion G protein-coupled receptor E1 [Anabrus simplex]|uniref:adhesion G protein-coupled receptor E1 n=1 Tax=Anabrus simplex TaxID=316456 RepID=UPI0035A277F3
MEPLIGQKMLLVVLILGYARSLSSTSPSWSQDHTTSNNSVSEGGLEPPQETTVPSVQEFITQEVVLSGGIVGRVDEYYSGYEYQDPGVNDTGTGYINVEPGVIPDPGLQDSPGDEIHLRDGPEDLDDVGPEPDDEEEEEEELELPDDSLADTDLHDHDLIDSVMYIYFGAPGRSDGGAGRQVLIVGSVISLIAQFLALITVFRRLRSSPRDHATLTLLNTELSLTLSNLVFMLGVQATEDQQWCETVALMLHYLHLVPCCWFFLISIHIYKRLRETRLPVMHICCPLAWLIPAFLVLICYVINPRGYETHHYCWMSVERGMLLSYMVPIGTLIMVNTILTVLGLQLVTHCDLLNKPCMEEPAQEDVLRKSLKAAAMLLPLFAVVWFLGVVALENSASLVLPLLFTATNCFLNWFLYICSSMVLPECEKSVKDILPSPIIASKGQHSEIEPDTQPLLAPDPATSPVWGHNASTLSSPARPSNGGELLELRLDAISTIST